MKTATYQERLSAEALRLIQTGSFGNYKVWSLAQQCYIYTTSYIEAQALAEALLSEVGFTI